MAAELWRLDEELTRLRAREAELLGRRDHLLGLLRAERAGLAGGFPAAPGPQEVQGLQGAGGTRGVGEAQRGRGGTTVPKMAREGAAASGGGPGAGRRGGFGPGAGGPGGGTHGGFGPGNAESAPRRDFSPKAVQNLLLSLGGLLLVVAAVVFTVVSWGHIGIGGRAAILAGVTGLTFAAPKLLAGRGLGATAETITLFGVALLFLDGYAARRVGLAGADGLDPLHYAALLFGLVALFMAGYSRLLPLRLPLPVAIVLAQFPLPLLAFGETDVWITAALTATAAADAALLLFVRTTGGALPAREAGEPATPDGLPGASSGHAERPSGLTNSGGRAGHVRSVGRTTAGVCFGVVWTLGVLYGFLASSLGAGRLPGDVSLAANSVRGVLLVALAVIGLACVPRVGEGRFRLLTAGSMLALAAGLAAPFWQLLPPGWLGVPYTVGALAAAAAALYLPGLNDARVRSAGAVSAGVLAALTAFPFLPWTVTTLLAPFTWLDRVWSGPHGAVPGWQQFPAESAPVVLGLLAAASAVAARRGRKDVGVLGLITGTVAIAVAPNAYGWGHPASLVVLLFMTVALVACLTLTGVPARATAFAATAVPVAVLGAVTALTGRTETYVALAVLLAVWSAATFTARTPWAAATALVMAVLSATGLIWAVAVGTRWQPVADGLSLSLAVGSVLAVLLSLRYGSAVVTDGAVTDGAAGNGTARDGAVRDGAVTDGAAGNGTVGDGAARVAGAGSAAAGDGGADPRRGVGQALGVVLAGLAVPPVIEHLVGTLGFYRPLAFPWTPQGHPTGPVILVVIVALLAATAVTASWQVAGRGGALRAGLLAWPPVLVTLPVSVGMPYWLEVGLFAVGLGPSAWAAARSRANGAFGAAAGLWTASFALSWALAAKTATLVVLPVVALVAAAVVFLGRERAGRAVRAAAAGLATLLMGGEALAAGLALEWPARHATFGMLAVACVAAAVAGRCRSSSFAIGVETAGYALAAVALPLTADSLSLAALACAAAGVLMVGTALRPDRRWAGYAGTGLLLVASWLRLLASDITVVEAYTVPFSLVLLAFGWWRARGRAVSSWRAYGTGLASSLLPSVVAMLTGAGWVRPLLLGTVCLAVLLAGARFRLQAPALLGGLALAAVALHELAPWITQAVMAVPRWVPMALGGVLLVVVGATYEARLRDVRRLRAAVGRMR
ncbi:hypothetical protein GCM10017600_46500 [Streptosporangium carneum]|uniref:Uncharacterized protein n=1 Tax=Streptosporangium carneum TaxID=47481 RepID=A0A9W6ME66_9ACTN|nr:hypothetical protein GCM10017600_46500 [Streptosporangium carneum]